MRPIQSGSRDARYLICSEAPGEEEDIHGRPFVGVSGWEIYKMLEESRWLSPGAAQYIIKNLHPWYDQTQGRMRISSPHFLPLDKTLDESSIFITNVCHTRPPGNEIQRFFATKTEAKAQHIPLVNGRYPTQPIQDGIDQLRKDIETIRPTIIIALGGTALWALTGLEGITKWRGSILTVTNGPVGNFDTKVIPTFHPADILREWPHRFVAVRDLKRAYIERQYPEIRTKRKNYIIRPSYSEVMDWLDEQSRPEFAEQSLGSDIETPWGWWNLVGHIACMGFATSRNDAICIPLMCVDDKDGYWSHEQETNIVIALRHLMTTRKLFFHKGVFDVMHIIRHWGFVPRWTDDTMVMQHIRFPGLFGAGRIDPVTGRVDKKGSSLSLVFCASMYCEHYRAWKDEGKNWNQKEIPDEDGWWSYNCLSKGTLIITDQGNKTINEIVSKKLHLNVLSMNEETKRIEWKPITGWHRKLDRSTKWVNVQLVEANGIEKGLVCTPDHELIGPLIKRRRADLLEPNDKIYAPDCDWGIEYDGAIIGTLLGDFSFGKTVSGKIYVQGAHNNDSGLALIKEKQRLFGGEFGSRIVRKGQGFNTEDVDVHYLYIATSLQLKRIWEIMVDNHNIKKPSRVLDKISILGLALWYMDDGFVQKQVKNSRNRNPHCCLSVHRYPDEEKLAIAEWFSNNFGYTSVGKDGRLNLSVEASRNFCWNIGCYIIPEFRYKLCFPALDYEPTNLMNNSTPMLFTVKSVQPFENVRDNQFGYKYTRYCLSIEDNHNFFTIHGLVSNCDDTTNMYEVFEVLRDALEREQLTKQYRHKMSLTGPTLDIMMRGFPMDHDLLKTYKQNVRKDIRDIQKWINDVCGHEMNTGSSVQMQKFFYEDLQVKRVMKGRGRAARPTLNTGALEIIAKRSPVLGPLCYAMSDERSLSHFDENMLSIRFPDDGCVHTELNIAGTETMRYTSTEDCFGMGLNCILPTTQILTPNGWIQIQNFDEKNDYVAQWSVNKNINFVKASKIERVFEGEMLCCKSEQYKTTVTNDHRIPYRHYYNPELKVKHANVLSQYTSVLIPLCGMAEFGDYDPTYCRALVATLADGSYEGTRARLNLKKQRKVDRFRKIIPDEEIWENKANEGYTRLIFRIPNDWPEVKKWGSWILSLSPSSREEMLDEIGYWDGWIRERSSVFCTADREQAEWVTTLAHLSNRSATITLQKQSENSWSDTLMYVVNIKPRDYANIYAKHWTRVKYEGKVYCLQVPSSYFLVKEDNFISVTGNCQNINRMPEE